MSKTRRTFVGRERATGRSLRELQAILDGLRSDDAGRDEAAISDLWADAERCAADIIGERPPDGDNATHLQPAELEQRIALHRAIAAAIIQRRTQERG